jgi:uracil-DNA glycosylase
MFFEQMHPSWQAALPDSKAILDALELKLEQRGTHYLPEKNLVMRAFEAPLDDIRVVIIGQDPYPTVGHAIGLSFAVSPETKPLPRSLNNILRELGDDLGKGVERNGDLSKWADRGVFLLNRHLTTDAADAGAHADLGWAAFTDLAIRALNRKRGRSLVAILWGNQAQQLAPVLCDAKVIASAHPSPLSARRGFFGSKPFSKANAALVQAGETPIDWSC